MSSKLDETFHQVMAAYVGISPEPPDLSDLPSTSSRRRWRPALAAGFAFVIVLLVIGVVAALVRSGSNGDGASEDMDSVVVSSVMEPVALGDGHVWPEEPLRGSPTDVALAFAVEVLGWTDAVATPDPEADPNAPVLVRLQRPGVAGLDLFTSPVGDEGRVLIQVGMPSGHGAVEPGQLAGSRVFLAQVPGAEQADITIRDANGRLLILHADLDDLNQGVATTDDIPDAESIRTVLIRYRDGEGSVITAAGGHSGTTTTTKSEPEAPASQSLMPIRIDCSAELSRFPCEALVDGDHNTRWLVREGGIGASVTLFFSPPVEIIDVAFINLADDEQYARNARIKGVEILTDDLAQATTVELADTNEAAQRFAIDSVRTSALTIRVTSAYPGTRFGDREPFVELALAEIIITGNLAPVVTDAPATTAPPDAAPPAQPTAPLCDTLPTPAEVGLSESEWRDQYGSLEAQYALAQAGEIRDTHPEFLGLAVAAVPAEYFEQTVYTGCRALTEGGITYEAMYWTNGIGSLDISWQEWPEAGDPSAFQPDDATTEEVDGVQIIESTKELIIARQLQRINTVRFFDGDRVVSVQTTGLSTLSIDELREIGLILWDGLPDVVP